MAGDIKSGAGFEGVSEESDGKPKKHYAVQLGLSTYIPAKKWYLNPKCCYPYVR